MGIKVAVFFISVALVGCTAARIDNAASYHNKAAPYVKLGMSEGSFVELMEPALDGSTRGKNGRIPKRYSKGGDMYVVYFLRVTRVPDGLATDDEFQPYTFQNGRLIAIGWDYLGGTSYTSQDLVKRRASASKTEVRVEGKSSGNNNWFKPYCPPSKYPIYGCPPPTSVIVVD